MVGKRFEEGTLFLPQLLMSAQAAQSAFEAVKTAMGSSEKTVEEDKIVLATVKGDIHDIGKNIVKVLLQNYGFAVIDLGKDVDCLLYTSQGISAVLSFCLFLRELKAHPEKVGICFDWMELKNMTRIALPSILQQSTVSIGMMLVQSVVNSFGSELLAGYSAAMRIELSLIHI